MNVLFLNILVFNHLIRIWSFSPYYRPSKITLKRCMRLCKKRSISPYYRAMKYGIYHTKEDERERRSTDKKYEVIPKKRGPTKVRISLNKSKFFVSILFDKIEIQSIHLWFICRKNSKTMIFSEMASLYPQKKYILMHLLHIEL